MPKADDLRPTLLLVGEGEPMEDALRAALDRHRMTVERADAARVVGAAIAAAPDLVVLMGDAVADAGSGALRQLAENPATSVVPVAVLSNDASLGERLRAFRSGAVALVERGASADAVARTLAELARDLPERTGHSGGPLGEATLDELVELVSRELRSGILTVQPDALDRGDPVRVVLGAGGPIGEVLSDFVTRLKPLIAKAEPLRYELLEEPTGRLGLFDGDDTGKASLDLLSGMRVLVMDHDPGRADVLAQALRQHGSLVGVTDVSVAGFDRARALDPEVVILDAAALEGEGYEAVRSLRSDTRLRWAALLVARWDELWPAGQPAPDLALLAGRLAPLVEPDRSLRARAEQEDSFDARLELTGPARLVRSLARAPGTRHVSVRGSRATIELDLADGLIVGAQGVNRVEGPRALDGLAALSTLLNLAAARVHVARRGHPAAANVMLPVEEALARASEEPADLKPSVMPAALASPAPAPPRGGRPAAYAKIPGRSQSAAFPSAAALRAPSVRDLPAAAGTESESGLSSESGGVATRVEAEGAPSTRDLRWEEGSGELPLPKPAASGYKPPPPPGAPRRPLGGPVAPLPPPVKRAAAPTPAEPAPRPRTGTILGAGARAGFMSQPAAPPPEAARPASAAGSVELSTLELDEALLDDGDDDEVTLRPSELEVEELVLELEAEALAQGAPSAPIPAPTPAAAPPATAATPPAEARPIPPQEPRASLPPSPYLPRHEDETEAHLIEEAPPPQPRARAAAPSRTRRRLLYVALGVLSGAASGATVAYFTREAPEPRPRLEAEALPSATEAEAAPALPPTVEAPAAEAPDPTAIEAPAPAETAEAPEEPTPPSTPAEAPAAEAPSFTPDFALPSHAARAADVLVEDALGLMAAGHLAVADQALARSFELDARNPQGFAALAELRQRQGRMAEAISAAEDAVRVRRRRGAYYLLLGDLLRADGRPDEARRAYADGMRAEPSRALREALAALPD